MRSYETITIKELELIISSLYYANGRLGDGLSMGNGKYKEESKALIEKIADEIRYRTE